MAEERREYQRLALTHPIDGRFGETGQTALRAYQEKNGLTPDGYPTLVLLERMRKRP